MCAVSAMGDHYTDKFDQERYNRFFVPKPDPNPLPLPFTPYTGDPVPSSPGFVINWNMITREEFEQLKKEVEEMKKILLRAAEYDKKNNEPHCEMEVKVALLKKIAEAVGVDLTDVFKN